MNITPKYITVILELIKSLLEEWEIYDFNPWNIEDNPEELIKSDMPEERKSECLEKIRPALELLKGIFKHIVESVKEKKVTPLDFIKDPPSKDPLNFWIGWLLMSENLISLGQFLDITDLECRLPTNDFRAWEPFLRVHKADNSFFARYAAETAEHYGICVECSDHYHLDMLIFIVSVNYPSKLSSDMNYYDVHCDGCQSGLGIFLNKLTKWGYTREQAWPMFEPKGGYFAQYFAHHAGLPTQATIEVFKQKVIKVAFNEYFPLKEANNTKVGKVKTRKKK